jgi:hypothetical protein
MTKFRTISSPVALAACGAFLVPEPLGTCFVQAALIWWLFRKTGTPCLTLLSAWWRAARRHLARLIFLLLARGHCATVNYRFGKGSFGYEVPMARWSRSMGRAEHYRALAKQCLQWAHEATSDDIRNSYLDLERQWLEAASKLDGLPPVRSPSRTQNLITE